MNDNTRNTFASYGLEMLKYTVLLVLFEQHDTGRQYATLGLIKERLDLPRGSSGQNHLARAILEILEVEGTAERYYQFEAAWQITEEGIQAIEGNPQRRLS